MQFVIIFLVILFFYVHILDQYKKSEDLEIYEMDYISNQNLQEVCAIKQPVLFQFPGDPIVLPEVDDAEIKVWDKNDFEKEETNIDYVILPFRSFKGLMKSDPKGHYFTDNNQEFLEDSNIREVDPFLKPNMTVYSKYDLLMGSGALPLQYHISDRMFLYVASGKISVKMSPWKSHKELHPVLDYDNYTFFSKTDPWIAPSSAGAAGAANGVKWLDFDVVEGYMLFVPAYWWYSIKFASADVKVIAIQYKTVMNLCAHLPDICRYYLQFHNTKKVPAKKIEFPIEPVAEPVEESISA